MAESDCSTPRRRAQILRNVHESHGILHGADHLSCAALFFGRIGADGADSATHRANANTRLRQTRPARLLDRGGGADAGAIRGH